MSSRTRVVLVGVAICVALLQRADAYDVGPNYHATSPDFEASGFIGRYADPAVRATVRSQLQGMADAGANTVKTTLWQVRSPEEPSDSLGAWKLGFPLSAQDVANLHQYALDVAAARTSSGRGLHLELGFGWLWCADYWGVGTVATTIGQCGYSWSEFLTRSRESIDGLVSAVSGLVAWDGSPLVSVAYLDGEIMIGAKTNQQQFLIDLYPYWLSATAAGGFRGSVYFLIASEEEYVFQSNYVDGAYPILNGRRDLYWIYRSTAFMQSAGLPIPERLDVSFYPHRLDGGTPNYAALITKVWDDMTAVYPGTPVGVAETYYFADPTQRFTLGQAFAQQNDQRGMPQTLRFWTTTDGGGSGVNIGYPFDIASFQLASQPPPSPCVPRGRSGKCK